MITAAALAGRHRFPGRAARAGGLRPGLHPEGLLRRLAARARGAVGGAVPRTPAGRRRCGAALAGDSLPQFLRWFDLIGLQRHIKVLGIFARLFWRDGKSGYLADLPRTLRVRAGNRGACIPELAAFRDLVEQHLAPGLGAANDRALARRRAHEGHAAGGRARRAHAAADRSHAQAAAAGGGQAADRLASAATGEGRRHRSGDQPFLAGRIHRRGAG